ncbi:MAG: hypothetical protein ACM31C_20785, partial [Acidobacteriota bacterium]
MKRGACLLLLAGCGTTTPIAASQLNLNRPIDMAFACYGPMRVTNGAPADPSQPIVTTAQPLESCDVRTADVPSGGTKPTPSGQEDLSSSGGGPVGDPSYYGFILEPTLGVVAVANWEAKQTTLFAGGDVTVLDADPLTPGKNGITVGDNPVALATDQVGCYLVTANAGSCDLSELDIGSALDLGSTPGVRVDRLEVKNASGQIIHAKPAAMAGEPPGGTIGTQCSQTATGIAYVAYPGCHLVAAVDLASGTILDGIRYDSTGPSHVDGNVTCPDECGGEPPSTGIRPVALDLQRDVRTGRRVLAIGADNSSSVTIVELGADDRPVSLSQIAFEDPTGTLGITQVAVSPQIGMGGSSGIINDDISSSQFQFVYGVATDRTVRVADILNIRKECDAQVDPRFLYNNTNLTQLSCLPVGDPMTPPRRAG